MRPLEVIAIGGHALNDAAIESLAYYMTANEREHTLFALTHGNGPQVETKPGETIHGAVSGTQMSIGNFVLRKKLDEILIRIKKRNRFGKIKMIPTDVIVEEEDIPTPKARVISANDPASEHYVKRIGEWISLDELMSRECEGHHFKLIEGARLPDRPYLRVVPSLRPLEVIQAEEIKALAEAGGVPIGAGGGGVPYFDREKQRPAQTVVDKDLATAILAIGATKMTIMTKVAGLIYPGAAWKLTSVGMEIEEDDYIAEISVSEARAMLDKLPAGSIRPKLLACIMFVEAPLSTGSGQADAEAVITNAENLNGGMRTRIVPDKIAMKGMVIEAA